MALEKFWDIPFRGTQDFFELSSTSDSIFLLPSLGMWGSSACRPAGHLLILSATLVVQGLQLYQSLSRRHLSLQRVQMKGCDEGTSHRSMSKLENQPSMVKIRDWKHTGTDRRTGWIPEKGTMGVRILLPRNPPILSACL